MHFNDRKKKLGQDGIVSLIVTVILMLVMSLIVIAFARSSRRAERDSLDRQLSTNAFYAAESGVNDTRKAIESQPDLLSTPYMTSCNGAGSFAEATTTTPTPITVPSTDIGGNNNAKYTCIFTNPIVGDIQHGQTTDPYAFKLQRSGGDSLGKIDFFWDSGSAGNNYTGCPAPGSNPEKLSDCSSGILRIELTNPDLSGSYVYYVYPSSGAASPASIVYGAITGTTAQAKCAGDQKPQQCKVVIDFAGTKKPVYARISSIYTQYELTVVPEDSNVKFVGAQVMIDVTGRAADVQRRIQIRYTPQNLFGGPLYALQSGASNCKKFTIDGTAVQDATNPPCWKPKTNLSQGDILP